MGGKEDLDERLTSVEERLDRLESAVQPVVVDESAVDDDSATGDVDREDHVEAEKTPQGNQADTEKASTDEAEPAHESASSSPSLGSVMAWAGSIMLGLGFLFFVSYAMEQGWLSRTVQVVIGAVLGLGITGGGHWLSGKKRLQGSLLTGVGLAMTYFSVFAGYVVPAYRSATGLSFMSTSVCLVFTAIISFVLAAKQDSGVLLVESVLLVFATSFIADFGDWLNWLSFAYTSVLAVASAYLAARREWQDTVLITGLLYAGFTMRSFQSVVDGAMALGGLTPSLTAAAFITVLSTAFTVLSLRHDEVVSLGASLLVSYGFLAAHALVFEATWFLYVFTVLLSFVTSIIAYRRSKKMMVGLSGLATAVLTFIVSSSAYSQTGLVGLDTSMTSGLFIATFGLFFLALSLVDENALSGLLTVLVSYALTLLHVDQRGITTLCFAALALSLYAFSQSRDHAALPYLAGGIALLAAYVPIDFSDDVVRPVWALLLAGVGYLDAKKGSQSIISVVTTLLGLGLFGYTVVADTLRGWALFGSILAFLSFAFVSLAFASAQRFEAHPYNLVTVFVAVLGVWRYLSEAWFTVGIGVIGTASLLIGRQTNRGVPRVTGLVVLSAAVIKLFIVDTLSLSPVLRIVSYVALGVIVLGASVFFTQESGEDEE